MSFFKQLSQALRKGQEHIEGAREVLDQAGDALRSGADFCSDTARKVQGSIDLGQRLGQELEEGVRSLSRPPTRTVDVKVERVRQNEVKK